MNKETKFIVKALVTIEILVVLVGVLCICNSITLNNLSNNMDKLLVNGNSGSSSKAKTEKILVSESAPIYYEKEVIDPSDLDILLEYETCDFTRKSPYIGLTDLVPYGCPECGYQLYCCSTAAKDASARLRCTNCDWESHCVYVDNCEDKGVARKRLMNIITTSHMPGDIYFPY